MAESDSKESLVQRSMTTGEFLKLFPWSKLVKFYVIFLIYTVVAGVVFFSTEQCLSDHNAHSKRAGNLVDKPLAINTNGDSGNVKKRNCTSVSVHYGQGIHQHGESGNKKEKMINIKKCPPDEQMGGQGAGNEEAPSSSKCSLKSMSVMKWLYFTVVHFHGADTFFLRLTSTWGQSIFGPVIVFGIVLATRLYTLCGFIGINLLNFGIRKVRARLRLRRKASVRFELLVSATALQGLYILFCAGVSIPYARAGISFRSHAFKWLMVLTTISDENMVPDSFAEKPHHLLVPIVLILLGYLFTSTFVATVVNVKHRLTYRVNAKIHPKKTGLKGWWV